MRLAFHNQPNLKQSLDLTVHCTVSVGVYIRTVLFVYLEIRVRWHTWGLLQLKW